MGGQDPVGDLTRARRSTAESRLFEKQSGSTPFLRNGCWRGATASAEQPMGGSFGALRTSSW